ncbi:MAG: hypothetical protein GY794_05850 [bacterium]|nr:hypothetical protein [bacterium]
MNSREPKKWSACGQTEGDGPRIVMVCDELSDTELIARPLKKLNTGSLLIYDSQRQLRLNTPIGAIAMFVLVDRELPETATEDTLRWLSRRWPHTAKVVVGETGSGRQELTARMGGAIYLVHRAPARDWNSLVQIAVHSAIRANIPAA